MMKIAICIKQVPDLESLEFDPQTKTIKREGVINLVNTYEKHALSAAKQLVEQQGEGEITVITMGPPQAREALMELLAAGADRAIHLNDRAFAGSDTLATSRTLAAVLRRGQYDLIFCGKYSLDAETGQVGPEVAEQLGIPQVTNAVGVTVREDGHIDVTRMTDEGSERLTLPLPALLTVPEDIAPPARPNRAGRDAAAAKPYETLTATDLGIDPEIIGLKGSPTWVKEISTIEVARQVRMIPADDPRKAARELTDALLDQGLYGEWRGAGGQRATAPEGREIRSDRAVWVVAELYGKGLRAVTLELLGEGLRLAERLKSELAVVLIGQNVEGLAAELGHRGADRVYTADDARLAQYDTQLYTAIVAGLIQARKPYVVLLPSTANGRDLAPRIAGRLQLGLTGDCIGFELDEEDRLVQLKPAFGGNVVAPILSNTLPQMATVRPGVLRAVDPNSIRRPAVEPVDLSALEKSPVGHLGQESSVGAKSIELETAPIVVGAGFGLGGPENMRLVEELAQPLQASVAVTRKIVDLGWAPRQQQVGLTGKVISPNLYFAVGIRGFFNHTIGIQKAHTIVSINRDPEAPIFQISNYGVVADAIEFLPVLTEALRAARGKNPRH